MTDRVHRYEASHDVESAGWPLLDAAYATWFAGARVVRNTGPDRNQDAQRAGIDAAIRHLGAWAKVDEKVVTGPFGPEADLLLEEFHEHDDGSIESGWIGKILQCDAIAWAYLRTGVVRWVPFRPLVERYYDRWQTAQRLTRTTVRNPGYRTGVVFVPWRDVRDLPGVLELHRPDLAIAPPPAPPPRRIARRVPR